LQKHAERRPSLWALAQSSQAGSGQSTTGTGGWSEDDPPKPQYPEPTDPVFPGNHIKLFNGVLKRANLKTDRDGNKRTAYSLRHTYICMRLMEGADIYQIAKNCRTSVEMIEKILRCPHQEHARRGVDQCHAFEAGTGKQAAGRRRSPGAGSSEARSQRPPKMASKGACPRARAAVI
jgi:hypothetical protein